MSENAVELTDPNETKGNRTKSPPVPSVALKECFDNAKSLYDTFVEGAFSRAEIASALGMSAISGNFNSRLFSIKEFGLIKQVGKDFVISDLFHALNSNAVNSIAFKQNALEAIKHSDMFRELLVQFSTRLPAQGAVAHRLETQKKFNSERAKMAANVFENSLRFAGVLDRSNNILPIREIPGENIPPPSDSQPRNRDANSHDQNKPEDQQMHEDKKSGLLRLDITIGNGRKVAVFYPEDITSQEALKVGKVLAAVAE